MNPKTSPDLGFSMRAVQARRVAATAGIYVLTGVVSKG